jgi:transposase-like protein
LLSKETEPMSRSVGVPPAARAIARKRRWSVADAKQVIAAGERSGRSWSAFAQHLGIGLWRISWWRSRLAGPRRGEQEPAIKFIPVSPMIGAGDGRAELELTLASGTRLRIGADVPTKLITVVLKRVVC